MSTNKAQGQTVDFVGVYFPKGVLTHGQLHVALSRGCNSNSLAIHVLNDNDYTVNIVHREINPLW